MNGTAFSDIFELFSFENLEALTQSPPGECQEIIRSSVQDWKQVNDIELFTDFSKSN